MSFNYGSVPFHYDILFAGAGLSAGLSAILLKRRQPQLRIGLIDAADLTQKQSPTWSFHGSDLSPEQREAIEPFLSAKWPAYEVSFPDYPRIVNLEYASVRASDFFLHLKNLMGSDLRDLCEIVDVRTNAVLLADGSSITARHVVDARGWQAPQMANKGSIGYQKFLGQDLRLKAPHGLKYPRVMDAGIAQIDGFRFFYVLPWTADSLLIEDTRYTLDRETDQEQMRREIAAYAQAQGWQIAEVEREEQGCLPIPFDTVAVPESLARGQGALPWGVRAGAFHPTTGYSFVFAMEAADWLSREPMGAGLGERVRKLQSQMARRQRFFYWINRMLFWQKPVLRYKLLQRFYRLPEGTVARFYSARFGPLDYLRFFGGRPPIPTTKALSIFPNHKKVQFEHGC
jgi:lycopene beta-cyclase